MKSIHKIPDLPDYAHRRLDELREAKALHVEYLKCKLRNEDWHGVEDAASDIRDMEAAMTEVQQVLDRLE